MCGEANLWLSYIPVFYQLQLSTEHHVPVSIITNLGNEAECCDSSSLAYL